MLRYNRCLGDAVDARRMLEWGKTDEISIRVGTVCAVKGIVWHVREEILLVCIGGIPSAVAAAAAARGDDGAGGDHGTRTTTTPCKQSQTMCRLGGSTGTCGSREKDWSERVHLGSITGLSICFIDQCLPPLTPRERHIDLLFKCSGA